MIKMVKGTRSICRVYDVPPRDFNLEKSSLEERVLYGIPDIPNSSMFLDEMNSSIRDGTMSKAKLIPRKRERSLVQHTEHRPLFPNWSGSIVGAPQGHAFSWIQGSWIIPSVGLPAGAQNGVTYTASMWIGLDASPDVLQAGCDISVFTDDPTPSPFVWIQWYPDGNHQVSLNFNPGDVISCAIGLVGGSPTSASVLLKNVTQNCSLTPIGITAMPGVALSGNYAEWVIENVGALANFGTVSFRGCSAGNAAQTLADPGNGYDLNIQDGAGNNIVVGSRPNATSVDVNYA